METLTKMLDSNLELNSYEIIDGTIYLWCGYGKQIYNMFAFKKTN